MRRASILIAALIVGAGTAEAKIPRFEVDVAPGSPIAGEPFQIVVSLEQAIPVDTFDSLLRMHSVAPSPQVRDLVLTRTGETTYATTVTIDEPGEWVIVAFPDRTGWSVDEVPPGYPDRIPLTVSPRPTTPRLVGFGLLVAVLSVTAGRFIVASLTDCAAQGCGFRTLVRLKRG